MSCVSWHSKLTGLSRTRGGATIVDGTGVRPPRTNSSSSAAIDADVSFIAAASGRVARFQTNSPVASMLATESFHPIEQKPITGGR